MKQSKGQRRDLATKREHGIDEVIFTQYAAEVMTSKWHERELRSEWQS